MICKKCKNTFPFRVKLNGQIKNLCNRKYCLECSPFGLHNTRPIYDGSNLLTDQTTFTCKFCKKTYVYFRSSKKGHTKSLCNSCGVNRRRYALKLKAIEYLGGKCIKCGYNKCPAAMHFHHKDSEGKEFGISGNHARSWLIIKEELDKCEIRCANCHAEEHYTMTNLLLNNYTYSPSLNKNRQKAKHGSYSKYCGGCRCDECKQATSIYFKNRRKLIKETISPAVV